MQEKITVEQAAKRMGVSPMFLRIGLRNGDFTFGSATKFSKKWSYYINPERFEKWMTGGDMVTMTPNEKEENVKLLISALEQALKGVSAHYDSNRKEVHSG